MFSFIKESYRIITSAEKNFLFLTILIIIFLSSLATIYAKIIETDDVYLTSINTVAGSDKPVYISQIEQARRGNILFKNLYTAEPQQARFFAPIWLIIGWFGSLTGISNFISFHLFRILFGIIFLNLLYLFISKYFYKINQRKLAFLILCFSSGFGIFTLKRFISPEIMYEYFGTDLWVSEGNIFLTFSHSALFICSQIFILLIFWWAIERLQKSRYLEVVGIGLIVLFLGFFHPYDLVIIFGVLGVFIITESLRSKKIVWKSIFKLIIIGLISLTSVIYFLWLFKTEPAMGGWASQNMTISPRFLNYLLGYGTLFFTSTIALYKLAKSQNIYNRFLSVWIIVNWYLLFLPLQFQRRLANGLHISMSIAGVIGLLFLINWLKIRSPKIYKNSFFQSLSITVITLSLIVTTLFSIIIGIVIYSYKAPPQFISQVAYQAILWVKENLDDNDVILTDPTNGNIFPSITGKIVYIGHGHQTIDWETKLAKSQWWFFVSDKQDEAKKKWLYQEKINYIFFSRLEDELGDYAPEKKDYLEKVFDNGEVKIFKVKDK